MDCTTLAREGVDVITRKEHMQNLGEGKAERQSRHNRYYRQFVDPLMLATVELFIGKEKILKSECPHFNDIPLEHWDRCGSIIHSQEFNKRVQEAQDFVSMSTLVCVAKECARMIKERGR